VLSAIGEIIFYAAAIFGSIQPRWGGGAPAPVVFLLNKPVAWLNSAEAHASLLDETDQGFYVLTPGRGKALFIPRADVVSIYFGPSDDIPKTK
jgi:hypothetical protein